MKKMRMNQMMVQMMNPPMENMINNQMMKTILMNKIKKMKKKNLQQLKFIQNHVHQQRFHFIRKESLKESQKQILPKSATIKLRNFLKSK